MADLYTMWSQARDRGEQRAADQIVRQNLQPALGGDANALSAIFSKSPDTGLKVQGLAADQRKVHADEFGKLSAAYAQSKNPQIYSQWRQRGVSLGLLPADTPEALTDPADLPGSVQAAQSFAQAYGGAKSQEAYTLSPGSKRFDQNNQMVAEVPFAPEKQDFTLSPDGTQWLPKPLGRPQSPMQGATVNPVADFNSLGAMPGVQVSSLYRDPEHNRKVGGVANSQHTAGTAGDFVVPPQDRAAFIARARQKGYEAIDEGDHVHVELPPGARASSSFGGRGAAIPIPGAVPRGKPSFSHLSPQEVAQLGLPPGTVAQRNAETNQVSVVSKPDARAGTGVTPLSAGEAAKVRRDFKETKDALNTFKAFDSALGTIPSGPGLVLDGDAKGRLGTAYNNARAALRIVYNTGVLQPGELPMLESALRDPTSFSAILDPRTRPQIQSQLDELYRAIATSIDNQVASYPQIFNPKRYESEKASRQRPKYQVGQVLEMGGKRYRVTDASDPNDPDVEEI